MIRKRNISFAGGNLIKVSLILILLIIALNLNFNSIIKVSYADSNSYSQSNEVGDINLTVTINSRNLQWDDTLELNITVVNTTSLEFIPNSQFILNISTYLEVTIIISMSGIYNLTYESLDAPSGSVYRAILIAHIPTLNPYLLSVDYMNDSISIVNVSFYIFIENTKTGFIPFFTFEHFIILYFSVLLVCGIYLGYSRCQNKMNKNYHKDGDN